ncbi:MAG: ester cyclase [bacterium]
MVGRDTRYILEAYLESHDPGYYAEDAVYTVVALDQQFRGREAIATILDLYYRTAFSPVWTEIRHTVIGLDGGLAVVEFTFNGRHAAKFLNVPASGRSVEVPMVGMYEFRDGKITKTRLYYDSADFLRQVGAGAVGR